MIVFKGPLHAREGPKLGHYKIILFAYDGNPNFAPNVFVTSVSYTEGSEEQLSS